MRVHKSKHDMTVHVNRQLRQCRAVRLGGLRLRPERDKFGAVCWAASELGPTKLRRDKSIHRPPPRESSRRLRRGVGLPAAGLVAGEGDRIPSELGGQVSRRVTDARGIY